MVLLFTVDTGVQPNEVAGGKKHQITAAVKHHKCLKLILSLPAGSGQGLAALKGYKNNEKSEIYLFLLGQR